MQAGQRGSSSHLTPNISLVPHRAPPCQLARALSRARGPQHTAELAGGQRDAGAWHSSVDLYERGAAERRGRPAPSAGWGSGRAAPNRCSGAASRAVRPRCGAPPEEPSGRAAPSSGQQPRVRALPSPPAAPLGARAHRQPPLGGGRGLGSAPGGQGNPGGRAGPSARRL